MQSDVWRRPVSDGVSIAGESLGPNDGPAIWLAHGGGQTRHAWKGVQARLAQLGLRVHAFDLRGHGESGWAQNGDYQTQRFAADLTELSGGGVCAFVGASLGGRAALIAASNARASCTALVLVDIAPSIMKDGSDRIAGFMAEHAQQGFASVEEAAEIVARYLPYRQRPRSVAGLAKNLRLHGDGRLRWHWDPRVIQNNPTVTDPNAYADTLRQAARRLKAPSLLVRGEFSEVVGRADAEEYLRLAPRSCGVEISGAHHMVAGDVNDAFGEAVIAFLSRTLGRALADASGRDVCEATRPLQAKGE